MPLVEVVRGPKTSPQAIATVIGYAAAMGKTPIVVEDCPGFVVNRVLTPYLIAFLRLVHDGADFVRDRQGDGSLRLADGACLSHRCHRHGYFASCRRDRLGRVSRRAWMWLSRRRSKFLLRAGRLGQKNGHGFYKYQTRFERPSAQGDRPRRRKRLLAPGQPNGKTELGEEEIVARMMLPLILEAARCVEDGIAASPGEVDMCLILGLGLPRYLGGALKYADYLGLKNVVERADQMGEPRARSTTRASACAPWPPPGKFFIRYERVDRLARSRC